MTYPKSRIAPAAIASSLMICLAPPYLPAQDVVVPSLPEVTVEDNEAESYVPPARGALRLDLDPMDIPAATQAVSEKLIEEQAVLRPADAVRNVSSVTRKPAYLGLTDSYGIRGFDAPIGLWNGFRRDHYGNFTDTVHLDRIEVIKGPASVNYGYLEPGGLVNYVSKRGPSAWEQNYRLTAGSFELIRPELDIGGPLTEDRAVRARVTGAYEKSGSFRDHVRNELSTYGLALDWDIAPGTSVEFSAYRVDTILVPDRGFFNSLGPAILKFPSNLFLGERKDRYDFDQTDLGLTLRQQISTSWKMRIGINQSLAKSLRDNVQQNALLDDGRTLERSYTVVPAKDRMSNAFAEFEGKFTGLGAAHQLLLAVDGNSLQSEYEFYRGPFASIDVENPIYDQDDRTKPPLSFSDKTRTEARGLYLQDLISLRKKWKVLLGLRQDEFKRRVQDRVADTSTRFSQTELTPRAGIIYQPRESWSFFVSGSQAFRPQDNFVLLKTDKKPDPERSQQVELGAKFFADDGRLQVSTSVFQITKRNVATTDPTDENFSILTGKQRSQGVETDLSWQPAPRWQTLFSYAYTDARVLKDNVIPQNDRRVNVPYNQGSVWIRHDLSDQLGLGLATFHVGKRQAELPNSFAIPDYTRVDTALYWTVRPEWNVDFHVKNTGNADYVDSQDNLLYPGAPRSFLVSSSFRL